MNIIVPKELYPGEKRVMVLPSSTNALVKAGHKVFVQAGAGIGINIQDKEYSDVGAKIISEAKEIFSQAQNGGMIVKMKAPSTLEFSFMNDTLLFCMLHTEQNRSLLYNLGSQNLVGIAMEDIRDNRGNRLVDQTKLTGETGVLYSTRHFQKMPEDMKAIILGYGHVATGAIKVCSRLGIEYKIMRRTELNDLPMYLINTDLLINAIAWPPEEREKNSYLVTREDIKRSNPNLIILDLSVDFPNPIETIRSTTYQNPYYLEEDRVHISIYGYPGLVPVSSSRLYSEQILPIVLTIADNGGVANIENTGELGAYIHNAVIDIFKYGDWKAYKPEPQINSLIE